MKKSFVRIQGDGVNMWAINPAYYDDLLHNKRRRHSNASGVSTTPSKAPSNNSPSRARATTAPTLPPPPAVVVSLSFPSAQAPASFASSPRIVNVPASPPKRRGSDTAKVPRSPRVRQKRPAVSADDECPRLASPPYSHGPVLSSEFDRVPVRGPSMEEIWLPGQCRSPSPSLLHMASSARGLSALPPASLFSPIAGPTRSMFSSTPDFSDQRVSHTDNWFSLDFPLQH